MHPAESRAPGYGLLASTWGGQATDSVRWREAVEKGFVVEEIDPELIDRSRWHDRFPDFDKRQDVEELASDILANGQVVPVMVRPHPSSEGRYELVYGHRRHSACIRLRIKVRAIVRKMDDRTAITLLSRENSLQSPPSFIERARQASVLMDENPEWGMQIISDILGVNRSEIARYRSVTKGLPPEIIEAIGPDPGIGRPAWVRLELLWRNPVDRRRIEEKLLRMTALGVSGSSLMRNLLKTEKPEIDMADLFVPEGRETPVVRRENSPAGDRMTIDRSLGHGFGDYLWERLDEIWQEWISKTPTR
jgi:ParB family chromosome partitioning protein